MYVYIYIYIYTYIHTYIHTYIYIHIYKHTYMPPWLLFKLYSVLPVSGNKENVPVVA